MDGNISFMGRTFETAADGSLIASSDELLLKVSLTDDYHNGSLYGQPAAGRQRWGDYSQVSVDPENEHNFYMIGQFAREYNLEEFGHPGGTGGSRWGTWIAVITTPVPEPGTWAMMTLGLGVIGALAARRQRKGDLHA
ncbi:MAG: PEP-CTERM sorting domain-containing protein [Ideonella sp.]|nr:PEP-CTERM sorting domain-containing protein [Ideonella sp.]